MDGTRENLIAGRIILGYNVDLDPIPPFNETGSYCWIGPSAMSCSDAGKWGPRPGDPENPCLNLCPWNRGRCNVKIDAPADNNQISLFGEPFSLRQRPL